MLIVCPACASAYEIDAAQVGTQGRAVRCAACRQTWFAAPEATASAASPPPATGSGPSGSEADPEVAPMEPPREPDTDDVPRLDGLPGEPATGTPAPASDPVGGEPDGAPAAGASASDGPEAAPRRAMVIDQPMPPRRVRERVRGEARPPARRPARGGWAGLRPSPAIAAGLVVFVLAPLALLGRSTVVGAMPRSAGLFAAVGLPVNLRGVDIRDVVAFRTPAEAGRPAELVVEGDLVGTARTRVSVAPLAIEVRDARDGPLLRWTAPAPRAALEPGETARFRASLPGPPLQGAAIEVRFADGQGATGQGATGQGGAGPSAAAPVHRAAGAAPAPAPGH